MSQAKVEKYKKEKANRKKILAKEKAQKIVARISAWVILIAIAGWAVYSGFQYYEDHRPSKTIYADVEALSDYMSGLDTEAE